MMLPEIMGNQIHEDEVVLVQCTCKIRVGIVTSPASRLQLGARRGREGAEPCLRCLGCVSGGC